mgnify:CR=1 FL=1
MLVTYAALTGLGRWFCRPKTTISDAICDGANAWRHLQGRRLSASMTQEAVNRKPTGPGACEGRSGHLGMAVNDLWIICDPWALSLRCQRLTDAGPQQLSSSTWSAAQGWQAGQPSPPCATQCCLRSPAVKPFQRPKLEGMLAWSALGQYRHAHMPLKCS